MPRINLLPVRALARLEQAKQELLLAAAVNVLLGVVLIGVYQMGESRVQALAQRQAESQHDVTLLADQVAQTERLKAQNEALRIKVAAIAKLRQQKQSPAPLLAFFADALAELPRVWLTRLAQQGDVLTLEGGAMTQGDVSAFQLALSDRRPAFRNVELALVSAAHQEGADYLQWTLTCLVPAPQAAPDADLPKAAP